MALKIRNLLKKLHINRTTVVAALFIIMAFILVRRLYVLQIVKGEEYYNIFSMKTTKNLTLKSTRGNIYDRNGEILAGNELSYSLTITDAGSYNTKREKALAINGKAYKIRNILLSHGDSLSNDFHVVLDENGQYAYNVSGTSLQRFKADVYGRAKIETMKDEEANATAEEMMAYLISEKRFGIIREEKPYTEAELTSVGLPTELTKEEILDITYIRYELFTTSYQKYLPVTIATHLSEESVAHLDEESNNLVGIAIEEDSIRVYDNPEAFSSIIGYTGKISAEELTALSEENEGYSTTSVVGKLGIEKVMETTLQGHDGSQTVYVDNLGKVTEVNEESVIQPVAGNDVYLTIDKNLQIAAYKILEQRIAGVVQSVIINEKTFDFEALEDSSDIRIPIYDVYNALIANSVIDTSLFAAPDASDNSKAMLASHDLKQAEVFAAINEELTGAAPRAFEDLDDEMKEYETYIVDTLLTQKTGILNAQAIDKSDAMYIAWAKDKTISMKDYLMYAASQNWIDIANIVETDTYVSSDEVYSVLASYIADNLSADKQFDKLLYKYLLHADRITPEMIINVLYDQGVLSTGDDCYWPFQYGELPAYDLMMLKINNLEITPAMLALEPCSGSLVVVDPHNGDTLACVTYPGYDNNRLANTMDTAYYNQLVTDGSQPFYNKATQQKTAPGSTFKLVTTVAGLEEHVVTPETVYNCNGVFDLIETPLACWYKEGHGDLNLVGGIENSCNVYFSNVAFNLGRTDMGAWSDSLSLSKLQAYAQLFDLDKPSGIQISEAEPQISTQYAIQSAIGQGTHSYTTTQLARYAATLANSGTSYNLNLLDKVTDNNGILIQNFDPSISSNLELSDRTWDVVHQGLRAVIQAKPEFAGFGVNVAGKTGTAQSSSQSPSHALFICYAPYEAPQVAIAARIANGYSSINAMLATRDVLAYYFDLADEASILTGGASTGGVSQQQTD
ncbi:MAG: penicillin-binding transpeptidase domain-containing protein [Lachnospiraceae bacterium]|nr:penicillin-binding transpeptidase domain-containing protein [Lachnospiraceae bacterium]